MTQRVFLPPLDSRWRLAADWTPDKRFVEDRDNAETLTGDTWNTTWNAALKSPAVGHPPAYGTAAYDDWNKRYDAFTLERKLANGFDGPIPKGTIVQIERYHVSRSGEDQITVKVLISPEPKLTPKKRGGKMRGAGRLYFRLADLNTFPELENVDDLQDL